MSVRDVKKAEQDMVIGLTIAGILSLIALLLIIFAAGNKVGVKEMRIEAIEKGYAEWAIVDAKGNKEFQWKTELLEVLEGENNE